MHTELIITIVFWAAVVVLAVNLGLFVFVLFRRVQRARYYSRKDAARAQYLPILEKALDQSLTVEWAIERLRTEDPAAREAIQQHLLAAKGKTERSIATVLLSRLGYVEQWANQAFGLTYAKKLRDLRPSAEAIPRHRTGKTRTRIRRWRYFAVQRAVAVANLGHLADEQAIVWMRAALDDPSILVTRTAVVALGRSQAKIAVPLLLDAFADCAHGRNELSIRSIKYALVRFPLAVTTEFVRALSDDNARLRFLAVDTIRQMCDARTPAGSSPDLPETVVTVLVEKAATDSFADVRARAAAILARVNSPAAIEALRSLLRDPNPFVRLHAVRCCGQNIRPELLDDVTQRITDELWRVREAAVRTAFRFGECGTSALVKQLLNGTDVYSAEQIAEEMQSNGFLDKLTGDLVEPGDAGDEARAVAAKLVAMNKTRQFATILTGAGDPGVRSALLELLADSTTVAAAEAIRKIATNPADPLRERAAEIMARQQAEMTEAKKATATAGAL